MYSIKEAYYTIQGEGANTGMPAIFCRFTGCNLWSGVEKDRSNAVCQFCDTDFVGTDGLNGGKFASALLLANHVDSIWKATTENLENKLVVCTGGEPLLQLNSELISAFHQLNFKIAIETNGTIIPPEGIDWICVSPKAGAKTILHFGNELKLVYPQQGLAPKEFELMRFANFFIQPLDGFEAKENIKKCVDFCLINPKWRLSIQTHKLIGIN